MDSSEAVLGLGRFEGYTPWAAEQTLLDYQVAALDFEGLYQEVCKRSGVWPAEPIALVNAQDAERRAITGRRSRELEQFLALGRLVAVHLPPYLPELLLGSRTLKRLWQDVLPVSLNFEAGAGRALSLVDGPPVPLREFWEQVRALNPRYKSHLAGDLVGTTYLVIDRTANRVGELVRCGSGWLVTIPDCDGGLDRLAAPLLELARRLREGRDAASSSPTWLDDFFIEGEAELHAAVAERGQALDDAQCAFEASQALLVGGVRIKELIHGTDEPFRLAVADAFEELGFEVDRTDGYRWDLLLKVGDQPLVVEVKGVKGSAAEAHAAELEKWSSTYFEKHGGPIPKSVLVVGTYREWQPDARQEADFPDQMLAYARLKAQCLMTGMQLLGLVLEARKNSASKANIVQDIRECLGVFPRYRRWEEVLTHVALSESPSAVDG
jgi:hypothetical protein